jgi:hypothetical protein
MTARERINAAARRLADAETQQRELLADLEHAAREVGAAPSAERYDALAVAAREMADSCRRIGFYRIDHARIIAVESGALA